MKVLAVDTSARVAAVAVMEDDTLLGEYVLNHKMTHSERVLPMVKDVMDSLEIKPEDIDVYAASSGPGSFTGLRIGITTIKAIAYAVQKPVVSVPTLDALAYNVPMTDALVCPIMDARNNQVYTSMYKWENGSQVSIMDYVGIPVSELVNIIEGKNNKVVFVGDGVDVHRKYLKEQLADKCEFAPGNLKLQRASSVAQLALMKAKKGEVESAFDMAPFYLRKSQAEREYERRMKAKD